MNLSQFAGQKGVVTALLSYVQNRRVPHALLFAGESGLGKKTLAGMFRDMLLCTQPGPLGACGVCAGCAMMAEGVHTDAITAVSEGRSIGVEDIRDVLEHVYIRPMYGRHKVLMIPDADRLTAQAQNALLKTLEEPPAYMVMLLTASRTEALLPTVKSRVSRLLFSPNTPEEAAAVVSRATGLSPEKARLFAALSGGNPGRALELAGDPALVSLREEAAQMAMLFAGGSRAELLAALPRLEKLKEDLDSFFDFVVLMLRDMMVLALTGEDSRLLNSDKKDMIRRGASSGTQTRIIKSIEILEEARRALKQNTNVTLALESMLLGFTEG